MLKKPQKTPLAGLATGPNNFPRDVALSRAVRFAVPLGSAVADESDSRRNSFAALPSMQGLGLYCEMVVTVRGKPDPTTGYLINITAIDRAVREHVVPIVKAAIRQRDEVAPARMIKQSLSAMCETLSDAMESICLKLTPYYSLAMSAAATDRVLITQSFEFAAAHRLHCDDLDDEANRSIFGKCNNPSGHGHNYRVEVSVEAPLDARDVQIFTLQRLEAIVDDVIIRRFDHKHLNKDTAEFAAVNPSVENITRTCFDLLRQPITDAGAALRRVTVWETEKTSCSYPA